MLCTEIVIVTVGARWPFMSGYAICITPFCSIVGSRHQNRTAVLYTARPATILVLGVKPAGESLLVFAKNGTTE